MTRFRLEEQKAIFSGLVLCPRDQLVSLGEKLRLHTIDLIVDPFDMSIYCSV